MKRKAVDEDDHYAGARGKLTRKELRPRSALTPYDRPALTGRSRGFGWISAHSSPAVFSPKFAASAPIQDPWPSTAKALPQSRQEDYDRPTASRNVYADPSRDEVFGEATNTCDNSGIAEVELWLKQRTFSRQNAIQPPHWNINAHSIMYVVRGSGRLQVVGHRGRTVFDGELRQGQLLVIPQQHIVVKKAQSEQFEWISFKTNENALASHVVGKASLLRGIPVEVLMNSYRISREEARRLGGSSSIEEMR